MHNEMRGSQAQMQTVAEPVMGCPRLLATDEFRGLYKQDVAVSHAKLERVVVTWRSLMGLAIGWGALTTAFAAGGMATEGGLVAALRGLPGIGWIIGF